MGLKDAATALLLEKDKGAAAEIKRKFSVGKLSFPAIYTRRWFVPGRDKEPVKRLCCVFHFLSYSYIVIPGAGNAKRNAITILLK